MASTVMSFEECPVCQSQISSEIIEMHVNQCFEKQAEKIQKSPAVTNTKKRQINQSAASSSKSYNIFNINRAKKLKMEVKNDDEEVVACDVEKKSFRSDEQKKSAISEYKPLAELMRPTEFEHYVGQQQAVGENSIIRNLLNNNTVTSSIFWGPPGYCLLKY